MFNALLPSVHLLIFFELRRVAISTHDTRARPPRYVLIAVVIWVTKTQHFKCLLMLDFKYIKIGLCLYFFTFAALVAIAR